MRRDYKVGERATRKSPNLSNLPTQGILLSPPGINELIFPNPLSYVHSSSGRVGKGDFSPDVLDLGRERARPGSDQSHHSISSRCLDRTGWAASRLRAGHYAN